MSRSSKIMADALIAIAAVGRGWGTTGEGHARCIEIANKALIEAEHADMEAAYQADAATPSQRLDAATVERCAKIVAHGFRCATCAAVFIDEPSDILRGGHPDNGCTRPNWYKLTDEEQVVAIRALATDPHQHGEKGA